MRAIRLVLLSLTATLCLEAQDDDRTVGEYQLKAAFLFNFAKFVEWPDDAFNSATDSIRICLFGGNPFGTSLEEAVVGRMIGSRTFSIVEIPDPKTMPLCHILFVTGAQEKRIRPLLREFYSQGILTLGETESFIPSGGLVSFKMRASRVRFNIDASAATSGKLRFSSKLLSLAENASK